MGDTIPVLSAPLREAHLVIVSSTPPRVPCLQKGIVLRIVTTVHKIYNGLSGVYCVDINAWCKI